MPNDILSIQQSLLKSKEYQLCIQISSIALTSQYDLRIYCNRGIAFAKLGDYIHAIQDFTTILLRVNKIWSFILISNYYRMKII